MRDEGKIGARSGKSRCRLYASTGFVSMFRCGMKDVQKRMTRNTDAAERWNSMLCDGWIERG